MPEANRPKRPTATELAKGGVEIVDAQRLWLRCKTCGQLWSPDIRDGRLVRGYWKCSNGCNYKA
jgi:hypothetical protein